jgi:hypothetical protein
VCRENVRSMPCRTVCGERGVDACSSGNAMHALGVHDVQAERSERGLQRDLWLVGVAGSDWVASTVASGR